MVNEEILGGLQLAVSKGESLKRAMMTFYNAGYRREEIEEAARALQSNMAEQKTIPEKKQEVTSKKEKPKKSTQIISDYGNSKKEEKSLPSIKSSQMPSKISKEEKTPSKKEIKKPSQNISEYKAKPKKKIFIFLLIFFLLILTGVFVAIFLFKEELLDFFNRIS